MKRSVLISFIAVVLICALVFVGCSMPFEMPFGTSSATEDPTTEPEKFTIEGPYTVTATIQPQEGEYYFVGVQHIEENLDAAMISSVDATGVETDISLNSRGGVTLCEITDTSGVHSFYCDGDLITSGDLNILEGDTIYAIFKNLLATIIFKEDLTGVNGPYTHAISNLDNKAYDLNIQNSEDGTITSLDSKYNFDNYEFDISYAPNPETPQVNIESSQKTERGDLVNTINTLADYMFASVANKQAAQAPPATQEEEPEPEEPVDVPITPDEPESLVMTEEIATLSENKDLFVKIDFSNSVDDIEFTAPTGGSYKVSSGNVEFMQDDMMSRTAYYRIPNAEMGTWKLSYDNAKNEIEVKAVTDNVIKINGLQLSDIKDGIITVTPTLIMPKGLNIDYEYHVNVMQGNNTLSHTSNIVNTKTYKAGYNASVMDLEPGTYKIRLRLEYEYNGEHYFNIYTSDEFTK